MDFKGGMVGLGGIRFAVGAFENPGRVYAGRRRIEEVAMVCPPNRSVDMGGKLVAFVRGEGVIADLGDGDDAGWASVSWRI